MNQQYKIEQVQLENQHLLVAPRQMIKMDDMQAYLAKWFPVLHGHALKSGLQPGTPTAAYFSWNPETGMTEVQAQMPINDAGTADGDIDAVGRPAVKVLRADYYGSYNTEGAHVAIAEYAKQHGLTIAGSPWECYVTDPDKEPDSSKWLTQVYYPVE